MTTEDIVKNMNVKIIALPGGPVTSVPNNEILKEADWYWSSEVLAQNKFDESLQFNINYV